MPPAFRNHLVPTGCDTPASSAASSLLSPVVIARQNLICSSRPAAGGRPGEGNGARPDRAERRFRMLIATSNFRVLRRPLESAQQEEPSRKRVMQNAREIYARGGLTGLRQALKEGKVALPAVGLPAVALGARCTVCSGRAP